MLPHCASATSINAMRQKPSQIPVKYLWCSSPGAQLSLLISGFLFLFKF